MPDVSTIIIEIRKDGAVRDLTDRVSALLLKESLLTGDLEWIMELQADNLPAEEDLMMVQTEFELRLTQTTGEVDQTTGWKTLMVERASIFHDGGLPTLTIRGRNLSLKMNLVERWRSFVGKTASEILGTIAKDYGLEYISDQDGVPLSGSSYQLGLTDWQFLKILQNNIVCGSGQRNAWVFLDNKNLYLRTINYANAPVRSYGLGTGDDRLEEVTFYYNGKQIDSSGGSLMRARGFDFDKKTYVEQEVPEDAVPFLASKLPSEFGVGEKHIITTSTTDKEVLDAALIPWANRTARYFGVQGSVVADVTLKPADIVEVTPRDDEGNTSSFGGKYPVYEVIHKYRVTKSETGMAMPLTTYFGGFRRTSYYGDINTEGANQSRTRSVDTYTPANLTQDKVTTLVAEEL